MPGYLYSGIHKDHTFLEGYHTCNSCYKKLITHSLLRLCSRDNYANVNTVIPVDCEGEHPSSECGSSALSYATLYHLFSQASTCLLAKVLLFPEVCRHTTLIKSSPIKNRDKVVSLEVLWNITTLSKTDC